MKVAVMGKDGRFTRLENMLRQAGGEIVPPGEAALVVTGWPSEIEPRPGVRIAACGPGRAPEGVMDLLADEIYQAEIAYMTVEGALAAAMAATDKSMCGMDCLVVGWGRIGRALTGLMACMGARVTVLTRREKAGMEIALAGAYAAPLANILTDIQGKKAIFSTAPAPVIGREALARAEKDAVIIDLASPPYGVDIDAARDMGLRAWREPGLPGRYCPENAARAIFDALVRGGALDE